MTGSLHVGDTRPAFTGRATSTDDAGVTTGANFAGALNLALHIRRSDATILNVTPTPVTPTEGTWSYTWQTGDINVAGLWQAELQVTFADGGIQTFGPVAFPIQPQIA